MDKAIRGAGGVAEVWWTEGQAVHYVTAHYPCDSFMSARWLIEDMLEGGHLSARYRRPDDTLVPIDRQEWQRQRDGLVWSGWEREAELGFGAGRIEYEAMPLRRLCTPDERPSFTAEELALLDETAKTRSSPQLEAVQRVLGHLYPAGVPDQATLRNKELYEVVAKAGVMASQATIRRAAGRR